jgi:hypothetical protein
MNRIQTATLLLATLLTSACATVGSIQKEPLDAGTGRVFQAAFDPTLKAAREALVESGFRIEHTREVQPGTWIIVGQTGMSVVSRGELVRVAVARQEERATRVTVHTRRRVATNIFAEDDYSDTILSRMAWKLR